jgi:hypothetical protein
MNTNIIHHPLSPMNMKSDPLFPIIAAAILAGSLIALANPARAADDTQVTRKGTWTNAAGGTGNWQSQRTWNKATQTGTVSGTATRPNGTTASWQGTATRTAPGAIADKGTITLSNGKTYTYSGTDTKEAPGTWDRQNVITTPSGATIDRNVVTSVSGGNGTRTETTTLPSGQVVTRSSTFTQTSTPLTQAAPSP